MTYDEGLVMILELIDAASCCVSTHGLAEGPLVDGNGGGVGILLVKCR